MNGSVGLSPLKNQKLVKNELMLELIRWPKGCDGLAAGKVALIVKNPKSFKNLSFMNLDKINIEELLRVDYPNYLGRTDKVIIW